MKQIHLILQSKGGVGKSLLATLMGLKRRESEFAAFVDLDSSTQSAMRQLAFIDSRRLENVSLLNQKQVLVRDNLIAYLESLAVAPFEEIFFDFGAPESEQFPALISKDLPFDAFLEMLNMKARYHVVIGGGSAYIPSVNYLQQIVRIVPAVNSITVWASMTSFNQYPKLLEELTQNCQKLGLELKCFGDFAPQSHLGGVMLDLIRLDTPLDKYSPGALLRIQKELSENITI